VSRRCRYKTGRPGTHPASNDIRAEEAAMAANRPTTRELSDARTAQRRADMQVAIEEGTLTVRQMTPLERKDSHALRAAGAEARAAGGRQAAVLRAQRRRMTARPSSGS
jgi:hypothetical protein